jgi:hypothetical protein
LLAVAVMLTGLLTTAAVAVANPLPAATGTSSVPTT